MKTYKLYIILLLLFSCEKKDAPFYEYLVVYNDEIKLWTNPILPEWKENFENGDWTIKTPKGDTLVYGEFKNGFRDGNWKYEASETEKMEINWDHYQNELLQINFPIDWKIHETKERPFQATLPSPENGDDKFFIILSYNKDSIKMDLDQYWQLYNEKIFGKESVKSYIQYKFDQQDKTFYYSEYTIVRDGEERLILNFLGEFDSEIYDITFLSLNSNETKKTIIFFEMVRSLVIKEHRFFSPYIKIDKMKELRFVLPKSPTASAECITKENEAVGFIFHSV